IGKWKSWPASPVNLDLPQRAAAAFRVLQKEVQCCWSSQICWIWIFHDWNRPDWDENLVLDLRGLAFKTLRGAIVRESASRADQNVGKHGCEHVNELAP